MLRIAVVRIAVEVLHRFYRDRCAGVSILAVFYIVAVLLMASFALDLSLLYVAQQRDQVVADAATLAAANTPSPISGSTVSATALATAQNIIAINGLSAATTTIGAVASPRGDGTTVLQTTIRENVGLGIGMIAGRSPLPVGTSSWASYVGSGDCITSLLGPVNIYGSSVVKGNSCGINAKTYLYVCGNADVEVATAKVGYMQWAESAYICSTATMNPAKSSFTYNASITDTYASDSRLSAIKSHLVGMAGGWPYGIFPPVNPLVPWGSDATYVNATLTLPQTTKYGGANVTTSTLTLPGTGSADATCTTPTTFSGGITFNGANTLTFSSGCYVFGGPVIVNSGASAAFNVVAGAKVVFVFKHSITTNSNSTLTFGNATVYMNYACLYNNSGSTLKFGSGSFYLWGGSIYNNSSTARLIFGTGPFYFYGGTIFNNGSLTFGDGPYYFSGGSLTVNSGATTVFGVGDIEFYGGSILFGGSSTIFGQGGSTTSGSGTIWMYGGSFSLTSNSLTAIGETFAFYGGSVSLLGVGTINAVAPMAASPTRGYRDIFLASWGGAFSLYQSNSPVDVISGLIYSPPGNVSIYGSQSITLPTGGCFQIVASVVDIYQNAKIAAAPCRGFSGAAASSKAQLVQ